MQTQEAKSWQEGEELFFILHNQEVRTLSAKLPERFYIKGTYQGGHFLPNSGVLGIGELATNGRLGWLELDSKDFFPMESDRRAKTPFVKGYMTENGFVPSERTVSDVP